MIASDPNVQINNLTGEVSGLGGGDTANFDIEIQGDGTARSFDLLFVRPDTNIVLGSIPVTINNDYVYSVQAVDADGDVLTYSLVDAPPDATIDPATGRINWEPPTDGEYDFTVQVSDGRGGTDQQSYTVTVTEGAINAVPQITSPAPTEALYDQSFRYQVEATDPDGDFLNYYLSQAPDGVVIDRESGQISWVPTDEQGGEQTITVRVLDGRGGEATQTFTLNVGEDFENVAPEIISTPLASIDANDLYQYQVEAQDLDGDALQYELVLAPDGMSMDENSGEIVWRPSVSQEGNYTVVVRVQDGRGGLDLQAFSLQVGEPNTAPEITSTASLSATIGLPYEYRVRAQDADGEVVSYQLVDAPAGMVIDEVTGVIRWTPGVEQLGEATVTVVALDDEGAEATQTYSLEVVETTPNAAPEITSSPRTSIRVNTPYLYQLEATDSNGDPLSYRIIEGPVGLEIDEEGLVSWLPTTVQQGNQTVRLEVSDGRGGIVTQQYKIAVTNVSVNTTPEITSGPEGFGATVERTYRYDATAFDADGDVVVWRLVDAPVGMSIDAEAGTLRWRPTADQLGNHTVTIEAIDAQGAFSGQSFDLSVRGTNLAPLITSIPITSASADRPYQYQVQATDAEGDALTYRLVQAPAGMDIDAQTGLVGWQPTVDQSGFADIIVEVSDAAGASTAQTYRIEIQETAPNEAPAIISRPVGFAAPGEDYTYQVQANDPNGDVLSYELLSGPSGMSIDAATGEITWEPTTADVGSYTIVVGANDGQLGGAQQFTLQVAANDAPVILSTPETSASTEQPYRYDLRAQDPNGDRLSYELIDAPEGMTIDSLGRIRWTPSEATTAAVEVAVSDSYGATVTQRYELSVTGDEIAPEVSVFPSLYPVDLGQSVSVFVSARDNVGVVSRTLTIDGVSVPLANGSVYTFTPDRVGDFEAIATATDAAGNVNEARTAVLVRDLSSTGMAPTVSLAALNGQVLTSPTDILGSVEDDNLLYYTLSLAQLGTDTFREIYRGTETISDGALGAVDTSLFQNDAYTLRLTAEDGNGNIVYVDETVNIGGDLKLGNFTLSFTDMELPVTGIPVTVTRTYDSLNANETDDFGYGWRLEFRDTDLRTSLGRDEQYETFGIRSQAFDEETRVYLTLPGGQRQGFTFAPERQFISNFFPAISGGDPSLYKAAFKADDGVTSTLSVRNDSYLSRRADGSFIGLQGSGFNPEDPLFGGVYVLTTKEGIEYEIDATTGDLLTAKDLNGNTVTFDDSGIYSDTGSQITFGRDAQGRITSLNDPDGQQVRYGYDANGDLVSVTDREDNTTRFDYNDEFAHYLDEIIDPLGRSGVKS